MGGESGGRVFVESAVGALSKIALRTAASSTHELACRGRRSDRDTPVREREGGGGLPENADPKRAWMIVGVREGAGRWGFCEGKVAGGKENGQCGCANLGPTQRMC